MRAHPGLDFVEDQERAALRAEIARGCEKLLIGRHDAALALNGLDQKRRGAFVDGPVERVDVVEGREREAVRQRLVALFIRRVVGCGERAERAPVKRIVARENRRAVFLAFAPRQLARELDRGFVRFGSGVAEEDESNPVSSAKRSASAPAGSWWKRLLQCTSVAA